MYYPRVRPYAMAPFVGPFSAHSYYGESLDNSGTASSGAFPAANRALYYPLVISQPCVAYRLFWLNGATVSGTNSVQVGIYNDNDSGDDGPGTSIILGTATTQASINVCQFDDITDTSLSPGRYWLALWCNNATSTFFRQSPSNLHARMLGGYLESSLAGGLPATATPAQATSPYIPIFGFTTISSP